MSKNAAKNSANASRTCPIGSKALSANGLVNAIHEIKATLGGAKKIAIVGFKRSGKPGCTNIRRYMTTTKITSHKIKPTPKKNYNLSWEQYQEMLTNQCHVCKICGQPETKKNHGLSVDHCHTANKIRGLLCGNCNSILGHANDSKEVLLKCIAYLES